jgi:hypothetical protein
MQCDEIQVELTAYLEGRLPPDEVAAIEQHLSACQTCLEEATAMRDISRMLSKGLKEWANQGVCPPDLMAQLQASIRQPETRQQRRSWWRIWPTYATAVAAAAVFIVLVASRADLSHQMASIPLVGSLAAHLFYPDADVRVEDVSDMHPRQVLAVAEHDGLTLEVYTATLGADAFRIQYALRGVNLDTAANVNRYEARVTNARGALKLRSLRAARDGDEVLVTANYEPVLPGQALTFTLQNPPLKESAGPQAAAWLVELKP